MCLSLVLFLIVGPHYRPTGHFLKRAGSTLGWRFLYRMIQVLRLFYEFRIILGGVETATVRRDLSAMHNRCPHAARR